MKLETLQNCLYRARLLLTEYSSIFYLNKIYNKTVMWFLVDILVCKLFICWIIKLKVVQSSSTCVVFLCFCVYRARLKEIAIIIKRE